MSKSDPKPSFRVAGFLCVVAVGLIFAPPKVTKLVRTHVRDATRPGLLLVRTNMERASHRSVGYDYTEESRETIEKDPYAEFGSPT